MPSLVAPFISPGALRRHEQPTFMIDELVVRPWELSDVPGVMSAYRDPAIQKWHARTMTETEALDWVRSWSHRWSAETGAGWAVDGPGGLVGRVGFRALNLAEGLAEAAYWVLPDARGLRVAPRSLTAVTNWMFE